MAKKGKLDQDDEERMATFIDQQVKRAKEAAASGVHDQPEFTELQRGQDDEKLNLGLSLGEIIERYFTKISMGSDGDWAQRLINLEIQVLVRSLKSSNVELG